MFSWLIPRCLRISIDDRVHSLHISTCCKMVCVKFDDESVELLFFEEITSYVVKKLKLKRQQ